MTPRDLARILLDKARADDAALRVLAGHEEVADQIVGFHAHQAIEKALKAVLTAFGIRAGRTHELERLLNLLGEAQIENPDWLRAATALDPFAVTFRYTELDLDEPFDRPAAVALVERAIEWAALQVEGADSA